MPPADLAKLRMGAVSFVNELYGDEAGKRRARVKARFVNNAMMATLLGAAISDALENGQVVSGVGGQYNFVGQSFALEDARSIILLRATRTAKRRTTSNILWNYGHTTIPRHLRDIVVTEYGIADLRGKSDRDVIAAMLAVADSRFQDELCGRRRMPARSSGASSCRPPAATIRPSASPARSRERATSACCRRFPSAAISPRPSSGSCRRSSACARPRRCSSRGCWREDFCPLRPRASCATASREWGSSIPQAQRNASRPRCFVRRWRRGGDVRRSAPRSGSPARSWQNPFVPAKAHGHKL